MSAFRFLPGKRIYIDGSAYDAGDPYAAAAGAAAVQMEAGTVVRGIRVTVPSDFPLDSAFAEHLGLLLSDRHSRGNGDREAVADCASVVSSAHNGHVFATGERRVAAGIWKEVQREGLCVRKTKAHRSREQAEAEGDLEDFLGNQAADDWAKQAARKGRPTEGDLASWDTEKGHLKAYLRFAARMFALWVPDDPHRRVQKGERRRGRATREAKQEHALVYNNRLRVWRCTACLKTFRFKASAGKQACRPLAAHRNDVLARAVGE